MESSRYVPSEYAQQINNPEQPGGVGTLEANNSGKIETRQDEETQDKLKKLLILFVVLKMMNQLMSKELVSAVLSQMQKQK